MLKWTKRYRKLQLALAFVLGAPLIAWGTEPGASVPLTSDSCLPRFARLVPEFRLTPEQFKAAHQNFDKIEKEHNMLWIELAENPQAHQNLIFVDIENALLKDLNDKILKDKDMATAVTNRSKEVYHDEVQSNPALKPAIEALYSDFKSLRYAIQENPEAQASLIRQLTRSLETAATRFGDDIRKLGLQTHEPVRDPVSWILSGYGSNADEAGAATRIARRFAPSPDDPQPRPVKPMSFEEALPYLNRDNEEAEKARLALEMRFGTTSLFTQVNDGKRQSKVLTAAAFDAIRKLKGLTDVEIATELSARFRTAVQPEWIPAFRDYLERVNANVPGIRATERVIIPVESAEHGLVSVDFAGQNSRNLFATAEAMALNAGQDARTVLQAARLGEKKATEELNRLKSAVENAALGDSRGGLPLSPSSKRQSLYFSGDDGMIFPDRPVGKEEKRAFLRRLASSSDSPANFRVTFLSPTDSAGVPVPPEARMPIIQVGEAFEKDSRSYLAKKLGAVTSDKVLLAVDLTQRKDGKISLHVMALSRTDNPKERAAIRKAVRQAIQSAGQDKDIQITGWEFVDFISRASAGKRLSLAPSTLWQTLADLIPQPLLPIGNVSCSSFATG